jgi:hypothetical protein
MISVTAEQIAEYVGVRSTKTVERHFKKELASGRAEAISAVAQAAFNMAESGKYPLATYFWMNTMGAAPTSREGREGIFRIESIIDNPPEAEKHLYKQRRDGMWVSTQDIGPHPEYRPAKEVKRASK